MQILRTVMWVVGTAIMVTFLAMNWFKAPVNFWPLANGNFMHYQWPVGVIALIFFLLGFGPMWFVNRANLWRLNRRIASLENSLRITALAGQPPSEAAPEAAPDAEPQTRLEGPDEP